MYPKTIQPTHELAKAEALAMEPVDMEWGPPGRHLWLSHFTPIYYANGFYRTRIEIPMQEIFKKCCRTF